MPGNDNAQGAVFVVCSFPRSGTHFIIDMLRWNFSELHYRPPVWASSEELYFNLDREILSGTPWSGASLERPAVIVKTHRYPFAPVLEDRLKEYAAGRDIHFITPYRRLDRVVSSYMRYVSAKGAPDTLLDQPDPFFRDGMTTRQAIERFFTFALARSTLINVEVMRDKPDVFAKAMADRFQLSLRDVASRLPARRSSHGVLGEIASRLQGRPASEVVVPKSAVDDVRFAPPELTGSLAALSARLADKADGFIAAAG